MVSHGGQMSMGTWRSCLWEILFPMLERVRRLASEASAEVNKGQARRYLSQQTLLHS